jgi:hypothetical protein
MLRWVFIFISTFMTHPYPITDPSRHGVEVQFGTEIDTNLVCVVGTDTARYIDFRSSDLWGLCLL